MRAYNFFVSGPKFTKCLPTNVAGIVVDHLLSRFSICQSFMESLIDFVYLYPFRIYLRSKSKVVRNHANSRSKCNVIRNRAEFCTFFCPPKFQGGGAAPPNICTQIIMPAPRHVMWKSFVRLLFQAPGLHADTC